MAANYLPHTLALFDADLNLRADLRRGHAGRQGDVARVGGLRRRAAQELRRRAEGHRPSCGRSPTTRRPSPIYDGLVHDYKMGEAIAKPGYLGVRRTPLDEPLDDFFFDQSYRHVLGATRPKGDGAPSAQVVNLDVRRRDRRRCRSPACRTSARASPSRGRARTVLASPNLKDGRGDVIDMKTWKPVQDHRHAGPGLLHAQPREHAATPGSTR